MLSSISPRARACSNDRLISSGVDGRPRLRSSVDNLRSLVVSVDRRLVVSSSWSRPAAGGLQRIMTRAIGGTALRKSPKSPARGPQTKAGSRSHQIGQAVPVRTTRDQR